MKIAIDAKRGLGFFAAGFVVLLRRPKLAALGMLPPLLVSTLAVVGLGVLALFGLAPLTELLSSWVPEFLRTAARIVLGILIMAVAVVVIVVLFVSLTLAIGAPIYEKISQQVERDLGEPVFGASEPVLQGALRGLRQSAAAIGLALVGSLVVFLLGLIPFVGAVLALVVGAGIGGILLTLELISGPFDRWGRRSLGEKLGVVNRNRMVSLGFGVPVFLLFSIPILSVVFFPIATAGATLLALDLRPSPGNVIPGKLAHE